MSSSKSIGVRYKLVVLPAPVRNHLVVQLVVAHNLGWCHPEGQQRVQMGDPSYLAVAVVPEHPCCHLRCACADHPASAFRWQMISVV